MSENVANRTSDKNKGESEMERVKIDQNSTAETKPELEREEMIKTYLDTLEGLNTPLNGEQFLKLQKRVGTECPTVIRGAVLKAVQLIKTDTDTVSKYKGMIMLTHISYSMDDSAGMICKVGAMMDILPLLESNDAKLVEMAVNVLSHLAGLGIGVREYFIQQQFVERLCKLLTPQTSQPLLVHVSRALSHMSRHEKPLTQQAAQEIISALGQLIAVSTYEMMNFVFNTLNDLMAYGHRYLVMANDDLYCQMLDRISTSEPNVQLLMLSSLRNVTSCNGAHVVSLLEHDLINHLCLLLGNGLACIRQQSCAVLSNVVLRCYRNVHTLVNPLVLTRIVFNVKQRHSEAIALVAHLAHLSNRNQALLMCGAGILSPLCDCLDANNFEDLSKALRAIRDIMLNIESQHKGKVCEIFLNSGGLDKIKALRLHQNPHVRMNCRALLMMYFMEEFNVPQQPTFKPFLTFN